MVIYMYIDIDMSGLQPHRSGRMALRILPVLPAQDPNASPLKACCYKPLFLTANLFQGLVINHRVRIESSL